MFSANKVLEAVKMTITGITSHGQFFTRQSAVAILMQLCGHNLNKLVASSCTS